VFLIQTSQSLLITTSPFISLLWNDAPQYRSALGSHPCSPPCLESCNLYQSLATSLETPLRGLRWCGGRWRTASRCRGSRLDLYAPTSSSEPNLTQSGALSSSLHCAIVTCCLVSTAPTRSCSPRLQGGRCCLERTLLHSIERYHVFVVLLCWLRLDFVPLDVVLGAWGSLRLLSILTIHSLCCPRPCRL
jgi:hypothetical protein